MASHSSNLAWRIPQTGYSPWDHKELDMPERQHYELTNSESHHFLSPSPQPISNPSHYSQI